MKKLQRRFVAINQEFYELTGDFYYAMVLGQMNFYQTITQGVDEFIAQENERAKGALTGAYIDPTDGWFYKSAEQLCEELMHPFKKSKALQILRDLVEDGWLMVRDNPKEKWDKVKQYRLDLPRLFEALHIMGHSLPKWDMGSHYPKLQAMRKAVADRGPSISAARAPISTTRNSSSAVRPALPTGTSTAENLNPLQAKDFFSSPFPEAPHPQTNQGGAALASPAAGTGTAAWPQSRDPEMPKANGHPDWCAAVRKYDEALASEFSKLFNEPGPMEDPRLARKYWKARRGGLTPEVLRRIVAYHYDIAIPGMDWSWKARDFHGVLDQKYRSKILPLLAEVRSEKVGELKAQLDLMDDPVGLQQMLRTAFDMPPPKPEDMPLLLQQGAYSRTALFVVMHRRGGYPLLELQQTFREELKDDLAFNQAWMQFFTHQKLDPVDVVGLTFPEIVALQQAATAEIHAKLKALP